MELVIRIPDELYKDIQKRSTEIQAEGYVLENAVLNGKLLPKGHRRLMILSQAVVKREQVPLSFSCQKWISETSLSYATMAIIEADTECEDELWIKEQ